MISTILVATDGSPSAAKALALASEMAMRQEARLVVLHVMHPGARIPAGLRQQAEMRMPPDQSPTRPVKDTTGRLLAPEALASALEKLTPEPAADEETRQSVAELVLEAAEATAKDKGLTSVTLLSETGDPAEKILQTAAQQKADLIVLGSRGLGELKGLLVGSVSSKVAHLAPCSCLIAR